MGRRSTAATKLSAHIRDYLDWTRVRNRTSGKDPGVLAGFLEAVGDHRPEQVTTFDVERWKTLRAKQVKKATVNRELNIVRGCFSRAVEWGRLSKSPVTGVKPFRVDNTRLRVLSSDEIARVLTEAPADLALMARVTLEGLLRLSEVLNLTTADIKEDHLVLNYTKNNKVRHVPISPALRSVLVTRAHRSGHVFGENRYGGRPAKQPAVTQAFRRLMRRLGIENASHHTLRHTGSSFMVAEGISMRVVQEIGGWTSLRMLERYTHPTDAEKLRAVEAASRLTRVGTKTGTAVRSRNRRTRCASQKSLTGSQLEWRPQRDCSTG